MFVQVQLEMSASPATIPGVSHTLQMTDSALPDLSHSNVYLVIAAKMFTIFKCSSAVSLFPCSLRVSRISSTVSLKWIIETLLCSLRSTEKGQARLLAVSPSVGLVEALLSAQEVCSSIPGSVKSDTVSPTARHRCDVSLELCCPVSREDGPRHSLRASASENVIFNLFAVCDFY